MYDWFKKILGTPYLHITAITISNEFIYNENMRIRSVIDQILASDTFFSNKEKSHLSLLKENDAFSLIFIGISTISKQYLQTTYDCWQFSECNLVLNIFINLHWIKCKYFWSQGIRFQPIKLKSKRHCSLEFLIS